MRKTNPGLCFALDKEVHRVLFNKIKLSLCFALLGKLGFCFALKHLGFAFSHDSKSAKLVSCKQLICIQEVKLLADCANVIRFNFYYAYTQITVVQNLKLAEKNKNLVNFLKLI